MEGFVCFGKAIKISKKERMKPKRALFSLFFNVHKIFNIRLVFFSFNIPFLSKHKFIFDSLIHELILKEKSKNSKKWWKSNTHKSKLDER